MDLDKIQFTEEQTYGGRGTWFSGRLLFWNAHLKKSLIILDRLKRKMDRLLFLIVWLAIFGGWLAGLAWLFTYRSLWLANPFSLLFFWNKFNPLVTIFLFSLWFDMFMVYLVGRRAAAKKKINYRLFDEKYQNRNAKRYEVSTAFSDEASQAVSEAYSLASRLHQGQVQVIHLFRVMLKQRDIQSLFIRLDVDAKKMIKIVDRHLSDPKAVTKSRPIKLAPSLEETLILAFIEAFNLKQDSVDFFNIISFCYAHDPLLADILYSLELDQDKITNTVAWFRVNRRLLENYQTYKRLAILKPSGNMNRAYTAVATPTLDHFSHDLTLMAKRGALDICVSRDQEISKIFESFSGGHDGVLLVGPSGVGRHTIVGGLAQLMVAENVPEFLQDKRLVELDVPSLVAGANASEAEERLLTCLKEVNRSGNIFLYISDIENLIGISSGGEESLDLSEVLADALSHHALLCLASTTSANYAHYVEGKPLGNAFTTIGIKEPDRNSTIKILESKVGLLESKYDIYVVYSALEAAVDMSTRYLHDKYLPHKAIDLLEKAAAISATKNHGRDSAEFCGREDVAAAISDLTGIPVSKMSASESQKLLNLEKNIHRRLIGQDEAVSAVANALRRARTELKDKARPIASFLFLGPTGVGKTELAKSLSEIYFGDENYLVRLDMSEYQSPDSVRKMIGDVDGTLGYLTEAVRKKPFTLVLLDEIEKANLDILNLFLQLLDDGRLTDGQGRTISFSESIIIATSNIGAVFIENQIKDQASLDSIRQELVNNQLNKYMRPELINRFDGIIVFKPLSKQDVFEVATLMLKKIKKNLAQKGINLKADKGGVQILAQEGYDPKFGARPLRRLLQDKIEDNIANEILAGHLKRRDTVVINPKAQVKITKAPAL